MVLPIDIPSKVKNKSNIYSDNIYELNNICPNNIKHNVYLVFDNKGIPSHYKCKTCSYIKLFTCSI